MAFQDPYEQLISDLGEIFRPQREWVQYRGLLLQFAVFFSAMAGGIWLISLFFDLKSGFGISLVFVIASAVTHLFYLGRPGAAWRMFLKPHKAWISRGIIGITLFLLTGLLYSLPVYFSGVPWGIESIFGKTLLIISSLSAAWLLIYKGFIFASSRGIVSWNSFRSDRSLRLVNGRGNHHRQRNYGQSRGNTANMDNSPGLQYGLILPVDYKHRR
jgi:DMSO reductase anchor subunit